MADLDGDADGACHGIVMFSPGGCHNARRVLPDDVLASLAKELIMRFPDWLSPDGDDAADGRLPADPGQDDEYESVVEWMDEGDGVARGSADEWLAGRTAQALAFDPLIYGRRLEILVQNGVVILLGELASAESRAAASSRAWTVEGVVDVSNQLAVSEADADD
ncbi:BON domain-containing protein [Actinoplanes sp. NPDC026619]|uniref:BON domain-containing protein n=1 Tax=Actinoplanes sp. NPDC026619 TaxID=3155798 RepID=UPI0033DCC4D0